MPKLYAVPAFLNGRVSHETYERWLRRKAAACIRRDRKRLSHNITGVEYRTLIHHAVLASGGVDYYTGEELAWELISTYNNDESKAGRSTYKAGFALLPTVDHVLMEDGKYDFVVCGWRTNDAKNDLTHHQFVDLCRKVVAHFERALA